MQVQPSVTFDTLGYSKRLQSAGFTAEQAEVQAETFLSIVQEQLVSKRDIKELEIALTYKIEKLEAKTETQIELIRREIKELEVKLAGQNEALRKDLKIWMGGALMVSVVAMSSIVAFLTHLTMHTH